MVFYQGAGQNNVISGRSEILGKAKHAMAVCQGTGPECALSLQVCKSCEALRFVLIYRPSTGNKSRAS